MQNDKSFDNPNCYEGSNINKSANTGKTHSGSLTNGYDLFPKGWAKEFVQPDGDQSVLTGKKISVHSMDAVTMRTKNGKPKKFRPKHSKGYQKRSKMKRKRKRFKEKRNSSSAKPELFEFNLDEEFKSNGSTTSQSDKKEWNDVVSNTTFTFHENSNLNDQQVRIGTTSVETDGGESPKSFIIDAFLDEKQRSILKKEFPHKYGTFKFTDKKLIGHPVLDASLNIIASDFDRTKSYLDVDTNMFTASFGSRIHGNRNGNTIPDQIIRSSTKFRTHAYDELGVNIGFTTCEHEAENCTCGVMDRAMWLHTLYYYSPTQVEIGRAHV